MKAFSFEIAGDMAFFKKNDANNIVLTTYNFIHKPAVLGIFGAILGLGGYKLFDNGETNETVEFYDKLKNFNISIIPFYRKPLKKAIVKYNNSNGLASKEEGGILQVTEQIIAEPVRYRIVVPELDSFTDDERELYFELKESVRKEYSRYPVYLGKNEFLAYFENFGEFELKEVAESEVITNSLVRKNDAELVEEEFSLLSVPTYSTTIFEELPVAFDEFGIYKKDIFMLTEKKIKPLKKEHFWKVQGNGTTFYIF
ncbi:MAG: CRISPR-associated protein Cas5 [Fervidobacterium sp.]|uniref:CRISPR-associated protein Cas5 n=1 Tax=Fervidobacterium TaxID=2422 RepID=UPI00309F59BA